MTDNETISVDIKKYAEALNNLIGVDSAYFNGDKDVSAIVEVITIAKKMEGIINRQKTEIEDLRSQINDYELEVELTWEREVTLDDR